MKLKFCLFVVASLLLGFASCQTPSMGNSKEELMALAQTFVLSNISDTSYVQLMMWPEYTPVKPKVQNKGTERRMSETVFHDSSQHGSNESEKSGHDGPKPYLNENANYSMHSKLSFVNMDITSLFNPDDTGKEPELQTFVVDIGFHDVLGIQIVKFPDALGLSARRDWNTLKLTVNKDASKVDWKCIDGFSYYNVTNYTLEDIYPNAEDLVQNCDLVADKSSASISDNKLSGVVEFTKRFNTEQNTQDMQLFFDQTLIIQTRLSKNLCGKEGIMCTQTFQFYI